MLFDLYSQYIRGNVTLKKTSQLIGKSNWIQYQARIVTMISVVLTTYSYEKKLINFSILTILAMAFAFSGVLGIIYVRSKLIFKFVNWFLNIPTYFSFKLFYKEKYNLNLILELNGVFVYSLIFNSLINYAIVFPFILADKNPEMRMTSAYIGQLLNFCASIINFNFIEPAFYRALDGAFEEKIASQIIYSKIASSFIVFLSLYIFIM